METGTPCLLPRHRGVGLFAACLCLPVALPAQTWDTLEGPVAGAPESIGSFAAGCVIGAERLAADGPGFQAIELQRNRHYGHPQLVRFLEELAQRAEGAGLGILPVGDLSQPRGGPMIEDHASHQIGLDVDVYLRLDLPRLALTEREDLDMPSFVEREAQRVNARFGEGQAALLQLAAGDARVARVFVHPAIKLAMCERDWQERDFLRTLRPWFGHDDHMHVRLHCPPDSVDCVEQAPPPPGDGCGARLASWLENGPVPARAPGPRRSPRLPPRCEALR